MRLNTGGSIDLFRTGYSSNTNVIIYSHGDCSSQAPRLPLPSQLLRVVCSSHSANSRRPISVMVNRGVSRACLTCKARRIGCDEGKPTCKKCDRSGRTCLGYKDTTDAAARPRRTVIRPNGHPQPASPISQLSVESEPEPEVRRAFAKFLADFVLVSKNSAISRGYLDGLEHLLAKSGPDSDLWRATRIAAMAYAAGASSANDVIQKVQSQYANLLVSFQRTLSDPVKQKSDEAVMTVSILGLYEMMVAAEVYSDALSAHIKGVSAILFSRGRESDLLPGKYLFWWLNMLPRSILEDTAAFRALSAQQLPGANWFACSLDALMIRMRPTLLWSYEVLSDPSASKAQLRRLKKQANLLNKEFSLWPLCQPKEWMPQTVGIIERQSRNGETSQENMPFWPGRVDSYFDLYVAGIWDAYRKCRLKLLQVVVNCATRLDEKTSAAQKLEAEIQGLVDDMCASIPFHLAADLDGLSSDNAVSRLDAPGRPVGGLLLMYPLYIASTLPIVPSAQRAWMKGRLRWIGTQMGIRQAAMLASVSTLPFLVQLPARLTTIRRIWYLIWPSPTAMLWCYRAL